MRVMKRLLPFLLLLVRCEYFFAAFHAVKSKTMWRTKCVYPLRFPCFFMFTEGLADYALQWRHGIPMPFVPGCSGEIQGALRLVLWDVTDANQLRAVLLHCQHTMCYVRWSIQRGTFIWAEAGADDAKVVRSPLYNITCKIRMLHVYVLETPYLVHVWLR